LFCGGPRSNRFPAGKIHAYCFVMSSTVSDLALPRDIVHGGSVGPWEEKAFPETALSKDGSLDCACVIKLRRRFPSAPVQASGCAGRRHAPRAAMVQSRVEKLVVLTDRPRAGRSGAGAEPIQESYGDGTKRLTNIVAKWKTNLSLKPQA